MSAIQEHIASPHNMEAMEGASATGQIGMPGEGPFLTMWLRVDGDRIVRASFRTYGCPFAVACGSWVAQWVEGKTPEVASVIEDGDLARVLGGLPLGKEHCASLAVGALKQALTRLPGLP